MEQPSPAVQAMARQLLAHAMSGGDTKDAADVVASASRAYDDVRTRSARLLGSGGFHALMTRALALAKKDRPELSGVRVEPDGSLVGLQEVAAGRSPDEVADGLVALLARLLGLLAI